MTIDPEKEGWRKPAQWAYDPERLATWALGIFGAGVILAISLLAYQQKPVPPILASVVGSCITALIVIGRADR